MKKRTGILFAMAILIGIPFVAKAASGDSEADDNSIKSHGSIIYEDQNGSVKIYAEDIELLQEKLASIPDEIFDPVLYSHAHVWEYRDVTNQSHTKHCAICGSKYDVTNEHSEARAKDCIITASGGREYPGYEKTCECGYAWVEESSHTIVCTPKDGTYHTQSCALEGTPYCKGMEAVDLIHMITLLPTDQTHHQKNCFECGYQGDIEECIFEIEEDEEESAGGEEPIPSLDEPDGTDTEVKKYCACGNYIIESKTEQVKEEEARTFSVSENDLQTDVTDLLETTEPETETEEEQIKEPETDISFTISGNTLETKIQGSMDEKTMMEEEGEKNL